MKNRAQSLSTAIKKTCFNGEGKGRLSTFSKKVVFSYNTVYKKNKDQFLLEIILPFQDPVLLKASFRKNSKKVSFEGDFVLEMERRLAGQNSLKEEIYEMMSVLSWVAKLSSLEKGQRDELLNFCSEREKKCPFKGEMSFSVEKSGPIVTFVSSKKNLKMSFEREGANYFSRLKIYSKLSGYRNSVKLELFQGSCFQS